MLRIAKNLVQKGHEVTIYTGQWRGDLPETVKVRLLKTHGLFNHQRHQSLINTMAFEVKQTTVDLVVGFNRMPGLDAYYAADPCFIEVASKQRGWWYKLTNRYRFFVNCERAVMSASEKCKILLLAPREKKVFQHWYQTPDSRFYQLPPNIPTELFNGLIKSEVRKKILAEFSLPENAKLILMVGSAFMRKGLDRSIIALASLSENARKNTWIIAIGEDNPVAMRKIAEKYKISDCLIMAGARNDVPEMMLAADIFVHAARSELAGLVIIEAMTAGLPVIVTENCGYAAHVAAAKVGHVLSSPFNQQEFNLALKNILVSQNLKELGQFGVTYTNQIAATNSTCFEADLLESFAKETASMPFSFQDDKPNA
jgi:UDP-glucose:(heptosyl)LPS alpha-1,3-glucosyltransferase